MSEVSGLQGLFTRVGFICMKSADWLALPAWTGQEAIRDQFVKQKVMLRSSIRCDQTHDCQIHDYVVVLKSDIYVQQTLSAVLDIACFFDK